MNYPASSTDSAGAIPLFAGLSPRRTSTWWILVAAIFIVGAALRIIPTSGFPIVGFDGELYRGYVLELDSGGIASYPAICEGYVKKQMALPGAILPPTRALFIVSGYTWKRLFWGDAPPAPDVKAPGVLRTDPVLRSLAAVARTAGVLGLALAGVAAWRMFGRDAVPVVLAMFACAPTQLHMSQNLLVDGFVAFWAFLSLYLLWENLQHPREWRWLAALTVSLALLVTAKENAFFVYVGLATLVATNRWARLGTVTPWLIAAGIAGGLLGLLLLRTLVGSWKVLVRTYELLVSKALVLDYAIKTCDGPWYRYFVDELIISPFGFCLALAACFCTLREHPALRAVFLFIAGSYLLMCNVRYGLNLRYATIWDLGIRILAAAQVAWLARHAGPRVGWVAAALVATFFVYDVRQYYIFSVRAGMHEMTTYILIKSSGMYKP